MERKKKKEKGLKRRIVYGCVRSELQDVVKLRPAFSAQVRNIVASEQRTGSKYVVRWLAVMRTLTMPSPRLIYRVFRDRPFLARDTLCGTGLRIGLAGAIT